MLASADAGQAQTKHGTREQHRDEKPIHSGYAHKGEQTSDAAERAQYAAAERDLVDT
jgi:hypothetical protein